MPTLTTAQAIRSALPSVLAVPALLALLADSPASGAPAAEVTIYRCTDASGHLTVRDTPCAKGERQQAREMLRPRDPPPGSRPVRPIAPTPTAAPAPAYRVIMVTPPRALYECVTADGGSYTSDTAEGRPRWVPLWTTGYPGFLGAGDFQRGMGADYHGRIDYHRGSVTARVEFGDRGGGHLRPHPLYPAGFGSGPGTWVRDACQPLPQAEVCDRLRDRRYELDRRYNSALQSDRDQITNEERAIDARLTTDCGVY